MKKNKIVFIGLLIMIVGMILTGIAFVMGARVYGVSLNRKGFEVYSNDDSGKFNNRNRYVEEKKELKGFQSLDLDVAFANVSIQEADSFSMEYRVQEERGIIEEWQGDKLIIRQQNPSGNISFFSIGSFTVSDTQQNCYIIIRVPKGEQFDSLKLRVDAGEIELCDLIADDMMISTSFGGVEADRLDMDIIDINVDSGNVDVERVKAKTARMETAFGNISIEDMKVEGEFIGSIDNGNMNMGNAEADRIDVDTSFGNITGELVTGRAITLNGDSSECVIKNISGNEIEVNTSFGDVELGLREKVEAYDIEADVEFGNVEINDEAMADSYRSVSAGGVRQLRVSCDSGSVTLYDVNK